MMPASSRKYACHHRQCTASFARPSSLKLHEAKHSTEQPHSCKHCHKTFKRHDDRDRHEKLHNGVRLECLCGRTFTRESTLARHQKKPRSVACSKKRKLLSAPAYHLHGKILYDPSYWDHYFNTQRYSAKWIEGVLWRACTRDPNPVLARFLLQESEAELDLKRYTDGSALEMAQKEADTKGNESKILEIVDILSELVDVTHLPLESQCRVLMLARGSGEKLLALLPAIEENSFTDISGLLEGLFKDKWRKFPRSREEFQDPRENPLGLQMLDILLGKLGDVERRNLGADDGRKSGGVKIYKKISAGQYALGKASFLGADSGYVDHLLSQGADPAYTNFHERNILHIAAAQPNTKTVTTLVRGWPHLLFRQDADGYTALHLATKKGHAGHVQEMIRHDPSSFINLQTSTTIPDGCWTALHFATHHPAGEKQYNIIRLLLEGGADPNIANEMGLKPLHFLTAHWHSRSVWVDDNLPFAREPNAPLFETFLKYGADVNDKFLCGCSLASSVIQSRSVVKLGKRSKNLLTGTHKGGDLWDKVNDSYQKRQWESILTCLRQRGAIEKVCKQHNFLLPR